VDGVVEAAKLGRQHLDSTGVLPGQGGHEGAEQAEFGDEAGAHDEVGVGAFDPCVGVGLEHSLDGLGARVRDERGEVIGGIGDLGVLPAGHGADGARRRVGVVGEDGQDLVAGEVSVGGGRREPPEGDVLEGLLPPG